jgi:hypothetical protein
MDKETVVEEKTTYYRDITSSSPTAGDRSKQPSSYMVGCTCVTWFSTAAGTASAARIARHRVGCAVDSGTQSTTRQCRISFPAIQSQRRKRSIDI